MTGGFSPPGQSSRSRPDQWNSHYNLGNYAREQGDPERAVAVLLQVLHRWPTSLDACFLLEDIYEKQGRPEDAASLYREEPKR